MSNKLSNNTFKKKTGIQNIQEYLESGRSITALEALSNFGIFRLASAIEVLRKRGMNIVTDLKEDPNGKTYARYTLVEVVNEAQPEVKAEAAPKAGLKVGDRVKVDVHGSKYDGLSGVIDEDDTTGFLNLWVVFDCGTQSRTPFDAHELTLVAPKKELKVGARVRTLCSVLGVPAGSFGVVTDELKMIYPFNVKIDGDGLVNPYNADELEVI